MTEIFSNNDVAQLRENPSDDTKLNIITKLARNYGTSHLTEDENHLSEQILKLLAKDISTRIRLSISEKFSQKSEIPYEVALQLANDMEDFVAIPMIQFSEILSEADLINIVEKNTGEKQKAVARRDNLSENLTDKIIQYGEETTIQTLAGNKTAKLNKGQSKEIFERYQHNFSVIKEMLDNKKIEDDGTLELIMSSSKELKDLIVLKYGIAPRTVGKLVQESKENTILNIIRTNLEKDPDESNCDSIAEKLHKNGEITYPLLVKSLGMGATKFFYAALARFANVPKENVRIVIEDGGIEGMEKLFEKAKMPVKMAGATYTLLKTVRKHKNFEDSDFHFQALITEIYAIADKNEDKNLQHIFTILSY